MKSEVKCEASEGKKCAEDSRKEMESCLKAELAFTHYSFLHAEVLIYSTEHGGGNIFWRPLETQWTLASTVGAPNVVFKAIFEQIFGDHWNYSIF